MRDAAAIAKELEALFGRIHQERMAEFPLNNAALAVEAVGFRDAPAGALGVLVTPWSINLLLVPAADDRRGAGHKRLHTFPAGAFEFIQSEEEGFGRYETCSLFSPALQFADQDAARMTAIAVLDALFATSSAKASRAEVAMTRVLRGDIAGAEQAANADAEAAEPAPPRPPAAPSRRDLFTGRLRPAASEEATS
jgi:[NiFe] hydrogenase assembly HybE family chaperone